MLSDSIPKLIYRFNATTTKISAVFFAEMVKLIQKFIKEIEGKQPK